jgi:hypothetical protein
VAFDAAQLERYLPVSTCEKDGFRKRFNPSYAGCKKNLTRRANHRHIVIIARSEPAVGKLAAGFSFAGFSIGEFFASGVRAPFPDVALPIRYGTAPAAVRSNATGKLNASWEIGGDRAPIFACATGEQKS